MITTTIHAAAFVLPAVVAFVGGSALVAAFRKPATAVRTTSVDRQGLWFGAGTRTTGTSYDPQSRGSTG